MWAALPAAVAALALASGVTGAPPPVVVNSAADAPDADPADGRCDTGVLTAEGVPECTLRAAIAHANAAPGGDTITFRLTGLVGGGPTSTGETRIAPATPYPAVEGELVIDGGGDPAVPTLAPHRLVLDGALLGGAAGLTALAPTRLRSTVPDGFLLAGDILLETPPTAPEPPDAPAPAPPAPAPDPGVPPTAPEPPGEDPPGPPQPLPADPAGPSSSPAPDYRGVQPGPTGPLVRLGPIGIAVVVNTTGDAPDVSPGDGVCSTGAALTVAEAECTLRAALMEAEASALIDTVGFALSDSDPAHSDRRWVIRPRSPLPPVTGTLTIDAATQAGAACAADGRPPAPSVRLDALGTGAPALRVTGGGLTLRGLAVDGAPAAVELTAPSRGSVLTCNVLGVGSAGSPPETAVRITGSQDNMIGGTRAQDANLLGTGSVAAVRITGAGAVDNTVLGNTFEGPGRPVDLGRAGAQPNDPGDGDRGPNDLLNHPVIGEAVIRGGTVTVTTDIEAAAGQYRVQLLGVTAPGTGDARITPLTTERVLTTGGTATITSTLDGPVPDGVIATLTAEEGGAPGPGSTSEASLMVAPLAAQLVSGTVLEDVDGDGDVLDDGVGIAGVDVWVFADQGNGVPDAGDAVSRATRTDASGDWSVTVPGDGTYWAAVDSRDITPAAGLRGGFTWKDVWAEQTHASAGAVRHDGAAYSFTGADGPLYGGQRPARGDGFPVLSAAEHVHRAVVAGADVQGLTTGFSFAAVTNTLDDPASGAFDSAASWAAFDADGAGIGTNPEGFEHAVFDGRYVYFTPSLRSGGRHGEVLRYDTAGAFTAAGSWTSFDAGDNGLGSDPDGYVGAVFDGRFVYFAPDDNGSGAHGEVLRLDTQGDFSDPSSWDAYDPGDDGVGTDPDGYRGVEFDGRYLYFAPSQNGTADHGEVLRHDTTAPFAAASSWDTYDPGANGVGTDPDGYWDLLYDGRYLYLAPRHNGTAEHGEVLRYDTAAPFAAAGSWSAYDPGANGVGTDPDGFGAITWDGRYAYFAPFNSGGGPNGEVLRLDTTAPFASPAAWDAFDPGAAGLGAAAVGFRTATFDGRYLYFAQDQDAGGAAGRVMRFDTRAPFSAVGSWGLYDPGADGVGTDPDGALGAAFDGRYLYVSHWNNGTDFSSEVLRHDTMRTGQGSLRRFLSNANAVAGVQSSVFAIPTTDPGHSPSPLGFTVQPLAALPGIADATTLDAATQAQHATQNRPVVAVDGSAAGAVDGLGLLAGSGGSTIRGLAVHSFAGDGIVVTTNGNTIAGNRVGIGLDGTVAAPNAGDGIQLYGNANIVGGTAAADGNVVSGNGGDGVIITGTGSVVRRNRVGTDAAGNVSLPNGDDGIDVGGLGTVIGGGSGNGNVISGNADEGLNLGVGGGAVVRGNIVGLGADAATPVPNGDLGVWVASSGNMIGGPGAQDGNTISANARAGVLVNGTVSGNAVLRNAMAGNGGLGIDLSPTAITSSAPSDGATPNDPGDGDTGANTLLNTPVITSVIEYAGLTTATYELDVPAGDYRVEFFVNPAGADPSGSGEGGVFRTAGSVSHPGGSATYTLTVAAVAGDLVTATATVDAGGGSYGSTSEFSAAQATVAGNDPPVNTVPAAQTIDEDVPLVFAAGGPLELSIADPDAGSGAVDVTLTATDGVLTLSGTAGLVFSVGDGTADTAMRFTGSLANINAALNGAQFIPTLGYSGPASLQIVTDDQGNTGTGGPLSDSDTLAITVDAQNDPPTNALPPAQSVAEDTPLVLGGATAISIADPDVGPGQVEVTLTGTDGLLTLSGTAGLVFSVGDGTIDPAMTFTATLADANAALDGLTFAPDGDHTGAASVRIVTSDQGNTGAGGARTDDDTLAITVTAVNDPPVITLPAPITAPGGTPLVLASGNGTLIDIDDVDAATSPLRVTLTAANGTLTLASTANLSFLAGDGSVDGTMIFTGALADVRAAMDGLTYLPTPGYSGAGSITADVSDQGATGAGGARTDLEVLAVTLTPNPSPPVLDPIPARTVAEGTTLSFTASATDPDLPGDTLTFQLVGAPAGAVINPSTGGFTWTPTETQGPGVHTFAVVVTDATSASDSESVTVTVTEVNAAPLIDPIAAQSTGEGDPVSLQPTATDPDVPAQALTWSASGLPPGLGIDAGTGAITGTVAAGAAAGSPYSVTVTVVDPDGAAAQTSFTWSITAANSAPVLAAIPDQRVDEQELLSVTAVATDPEGQAVRYALRSAPAGMTIDASNGRIRWTPSEAQGPDAVTVRVAATDNGTPETTAERTFTVRVAEVNRPPVVAPIPDREVRVGTGVSVVAEAGDPDIPANVLRFTAEGPDGLAIDDSGTVTWTPVAADVGEHRVRVVVLDDGSPRRQAEVAFTVTVLPEAGGDGPSPGPSPGPPTGPDAPPVLPAPVAPPTVPVTPVRPPVARPGGGTNPARRESRQLGSALLDLPTPVLPQPPVRDTRVTVTLTAPLEALAAAAELDVPVQLLSMGGAWTFLVIALAGVRRQRQRPFSVVAVPAGRVLRVLTAPNPRAEARFLLRPGAGPVWSRSLPRRRGRRWWVELETPAGPGHVDARHLRDARADLEG